MHSPQIYYSLHIPRSFPSKSRLNQAESSSKRINRSINFLGQRLLPAYMLMSVQSESEGAATASKLPRRSQWSKIVARLEHTRGRISPDAVARAEPSKVSRGTKATICPRNGNRSPAEPGNEIRAGSRPSFPRGRIDLNVHREEPRFLDRWVFPNLAKDCDSRSYIS